MLRKGFGSPIAQVGNEVAQMGRRTKRRPQNGGDSQAMWSKFGQPYEKRDLSLSLPKERQTHETSMSCALVTSRPSKGKNKV